MRSRRRTAPRSARSTAMRLAATSSRLAAAAASANAVTRRLICSSEDAIEDSSDSSEGSGRCGAIPPSSPIAPQTGESAATGPIRCTHAETSRSSGPRTGFSWRPAPAEPCGPGPGLRSPRHCRGRPDARDAALREYTARFDRVDLDEIRVPASEIAVRGRPAEPVSARGAHRGCSSHRVVPPPPPIEPGDVRTQRDLGRPPRAAGRPRGSMSPVGWRATPRAFS